MSETVELLKTPLYDLHVELGGRMVAFAGYSMPVQYADGILAEHAWTREHAGLFDVSHMGQARLAGAGAAAALESLAPSDIAGLGPGAQRYTVLLNEAGGVVDDLMVSRPDEDGLFLVVNASEKAGDFDLIREAAAGRAALTPLTDRALLALQGPSAHQVMANFANPASDLKFMQAMATPVAGVDCLVTRSGYTGEDGFEISAPAARAGELARVLLSHGEVKPIGLGARDSLRLEAGLCLYGHDIDTTTSPVEAGLVWTIAKPRRQSGGFPGFERIARELADGPERKRVGFRMAGRLPAREGCAVFVDGAPVGKVTSGGFAPTLGAPVGLAYVSAPFAKPGQALEIDIRGRRHEAEVASLPFTPHRYRRS